MTEDNFLNNIRSPEDLKKLSVGEMYQLAEEIRVKLIETVSENGGHLASNLGVVELTLAIHSVMDLPKDKIVWDVGHQSYTHKLLTGRCGLINTIRRENGLAGFPKRQESEYDSFNTGHSSTSVSAAFGIASGSTISGDKHYTVAVIGDGALSGGLALEGINNAGRSKENLIVILNDNKMSISKNVGSMARYLTSLRIRPTYLDTKSRVHRGLNKMPVLGKRLSHIISGTKRWIHKNFFGHEPTMFEQFGFKYYGPFDGHDIAQLQTALQAARRVEGPVLIHICTIKGKGYEYAEKDPRVFHGISAFDIETGEPKSSSKGYSDVFGDFMCRTAQDDKKVCAITAAMAMGTGLSDFAKKYKKRFFDVGIAEEHAVTFAAGLAVENIIPVFAVYSTFLQRSYDQILHDAALQHLHIVLAIDRAGIVGEDGETHQGIFDAAFLNTIPDTTVFAPSSFAELDDMMYQALYETQSVAAVRYPRGGELFIPEDYKYNKSDYSIYGNTDADLLIVTYGRLFSYACQTYEEMKKNGIDVCILKLNRIKPVSDDAWAAASGFSKCFFFEEGIKCGGIGETFGIGLYQRGFRGHFFLTAIEGFVPQAKVDSALHRLGLDAQGMKEKLLAEITEWSDEKYGEKEKA